MDTCAHKLSLTETGVYVDYGALLESELPEMKLECTIKGRF